MVVELSQIKQILSHSSYFGYAFAQLDIELPALINIDSLPRNAAIHHIFSVKHRLFARQMWLMITSVTNGWVNVISKKMLFRGLCLDLKISFKEYESYENTVQIFTRPKSYSSEMKSVMRNVECLLPIFDQKY